MDERRPETSNNATAVDATRSPRTSRCQADPWWDGLAPTCGSLPDEVLIRILSLLDVDHLTLLRFTSRQWRAVCGDILASDLQRLAEETGRFMVGTIIDGWHERTVRIDDPLDKHAQWPWGCTCRATDKCVRWSRCRECDQAGGGTSPAMAGLVDRGWTCDPLSRLAAHGHLGLLRWAIENCVEACGPEEIPHPHYARQPEPCGYNDLAQLASAQLGVRRCGSHMSWLFRRLPALFELDNLVRPASASPTDIGALVSRCEKLREAVELMSSLGEDDKGARGHRPIASARVRIQGIYAAAAAEGRLECVEWLHDAGYPCGPLALAEAARGGHRELVDWLIERGEFCYSCPTHRHVLVDAVAEALRGGRVDIARYCFARGVFRSEERVSPSAEIGKVHRRWARNAALSGSIEALDFLIEEVGVRVDPAWEWRRSEAVASPNPKYTERAIDALIRPHDSIRRLMSVGPDIIENVWCDAVRNGWTDTAAWALDRMARCPFDGMSHRISIDRSTISEVMRAADRFGGRETAPAWQGICAFIARALVVFAGRGDVTSFANLAEWVNSRDPKIFGKVSRGSGWTYRSRAGTLCDDRFGFGQALPWAKGLIGAMEEMVGTRPRDQSEWVRPSPPDRLHLASMAACLDSLSLRLAELDTMLSPVSPATESLTWEGEGEGEGEGQGEEKAAGVGEGPRSWPYPWQTSGGSTNWGETPAKEGEGEEGEEEEEGGEEGDDGVTSPATPSCPPMRRRTSERSPDDRLDPSGDDEGDESKHGAPWRTSDVELMASHRDSVYEVSDAGPKVMDDAMCGSVATPTAPDASHDGRRDGDGGGDSGRDDGSHRGESVESPPWSRSRRSPPGSSTPPRSAPATSAETSPDRARSLRVGGGPLRPPLRPLTLMGIPRQATSSEVRYPFAQLLGSREHPRPHDASDTLAGLISGIGATPSNGGRRRPVRLSGLIPGHAGRLNNGWTSQIALPLPLRGRSNDLGMACMPPRRSPEQRRSEGVPEGDPTLADSGLARTAAQLPRSVLIRLDASLSVASRFALRFVCRGWWHALSYNSAGGSGDGLAAELYEITGLHPNDDLTIGACMQDLIDGPHRSSLLSWALSPSGGDAVRRVAVAESRLWLSRAVERCRIDDAHALRRAGCAWDPAALCECRGERAGELIAWCIQEGCACPKGAYAQAARIGDTALMAAMGSPKFAGRTLPCPRDATACSRAAAARSFEALRWLRGDGCPWDGYTLMALVGVGAADQVAWALDEGCPMSEGIYERAAGVNQFPMERWRCEKEGAGRVVDPMGVDVSLDMDIDVEGIAVRMLDMIHAAEVERGVALARTPLPCAAAARMGRQRVIVWLMRHGFPIDASACASAASTGMLGTLMWLRGIGVEWDERTATSVVMCGQQECLEYVIEERCPIDIHAGGSLVHSFVRYEEWALQMMARRG